MQDYQNLRKLYHFVFFISTFRHFIVEQFDSVKIILNSLKDIDSIFNLFHELRTISAQRLLLDKIALG